MTKEERRASRHMEKEEKMKQREAREKMTPEERRAEKETRKAERQARKVEAKAKRSERRNNGRELAEETQTAHAIFAAVIAPVQVRTSLFKPTNSFYLRSAPQRKYRVFRGRPRCVPTARVFVGCRICFLFCLPIIEQGPRPFPHRSHTKRVQ